MPESPPQISSKTKHRIHTTINYVTATAFLSSIASLLFSLIVYSEIAFLYTVGAGLTSILMMVMFPPAPDYFQITLREFGGDSHAD